MNIDITTVFFAAKRYWQNEEVLTAAYENLKIQLGAENAFLVTDGEIPADLQSDISENIVIVPMSGAIQKSVVETANRYKRAVIYAAYIKGNSGAKTENLMLENNAAPTVMDCWSVLRQNHPYAQLALDREALESYIRVFKAYDTIKGSKLLLIGETEPWVVSASHNVKDYEKLGITIEKVSQQEVLDLYEKAQDKDAEIYYHKFKDNACKIQEPDEDDLENAARMTSVFMGILEKYNADGMAIACFDLLKSGTTSCLAVSYINDCTQKIAACEGDLDSACTMLFMKKLCSGNLWMANPGLYPGGLVNFSHCTAPVSVDCGCDCSYMLRSHHESGIGVSLQVELPAKRRVTACRISGSCNKITIQNGTTETGEYLPSCRTQLYVRFDDFSQYIDTALGCHQVFCFEDIKKEAQMLSDLMGIECITK